MSRISLITNVVKKCMYVGATDVKTYEGKKNSYANNNNDK